MWMQAIFRRQFIRPRVTYALTRISKTTRLTLNYRLALIHVPLFFRSYALDEPHEYMGSASAGITITIEK